MCQLSEVTGPVGNVTGWLSLTQSDSRRESIAVAAAKWGHITVIDALRHRSRYGLLIV
jgi:hypothetical protein